MAGKPRKRELTPEEKQYVMENHDSMTVFSMAKHLGIPFDTLKKRMLEMGLDCNLTDNAWSETDLYRLRELAARRTTAEKIASALGRTENAVYIKARRNGIVIYQPCRKWTLEDKDYLRRNWGKIRLATIAKTLSREIDAVVQQAHKMHLPAVYGNSEEISLSDFCKATGISRDRVTRNFVPNYGFPLLSRKYGKTKYYYFVDQEGVLDWLERHKPLWDASKTEQGFFVPEPEWLTEKRRHDMNDKAHLDRNARRRTWTADETRKAIDLWKLGKTVDQIAESLGRLPSSVESQLNKNGPGSPRPIFWHGNELKFLEENYETMSDQELAGALGRSAPAIESRRLQLGFCRTDREARAHRKNYVAEHWDSMSDKQIAAELDIPASTVASIRHGLGLYRKPRRQT